jgi:hypothetical protein
MIEIRLGYVAEVADVVDEDSDVVEANGRESGGGATLQVGFGEIEERELDVDGVFLLQLGLQGSQALYIASEEKH